MASYQKGWRAYNLSQIAGYRIKAVKRAIYVTAGILLPNL